jgi:tRNA(Ile)-lysidine synthase
LLAQLRALAGSPVLACAVAWSGGMDSTVLLHLLHQARRLPRARLQLRALHVDHGLQPAAVDFRRFCKRVAGQWQVPLVVLSAKVALARGESVEQAARHARRAALAEALLPGEALLTAQHADDQLETVMLALLRGAGPAGLSGMPASMAFGAFRQLRPLLEFTRADLAAYAGAHGLAWIDDPTNLDPRFDRNYLRTRVLPAMRERWPALARTVARSARHCAGAASLQSAIASRDLQLAADGNDLAIPVLRRWDPARRAAVLREWLAAAGVRAPNERHLREIEAMMAARVDAHPQLHLPDATVSRVGTRLHVALRAPI